jgi:phenylalanine-4-hydroxylase
MSNTNIDHQVDSSMQPDRTSEDSGEAWFSRLLENETIRNLPDHLKQYIVDQNYDAYTPIDHAVWRYVLRQSRHFLKDHAHDIYLEGLKKTGLKVESIPSIEEMNRILSGIGWAAVPVNGFIPPAAFMEFQAYRVLVVAADMRQLHHIEYTPSPDIIHEAAGHAPIIADPEYAEYLRLFGEVGSKAMSSKKDYQLYEAIRKLSVLKEAPNADPAEIEAAEKDVLEKQENLGEPSEMALLSRLHWWTVEYGLVGDINNPKLYGAGLLSSIGEAASCLKDDVKKIPYSLDAMNYAFDITTRQPQLFVTPDFSYLNDVLEQFARAMAFKKGGLEGLNKAIECDSTSTAVYSSGLQVSGTFTEVLTDGKEHPVFIRTTGPTNLSFGDKELEGHDKNYHKEGFSSPVGRLKDADAPLEELSDKRLEDMGVVTGQTVELVFESGIRVNGLLEKITRRDGRIILMTFEQCRVTDNGNVLFQPDWGTYDMAVGEKIVSVFAGAADKDAFEQPSRVSQTRTIKVTFDEYITALHNLYGMIRSYRETSADDSILTEAWQKIKENYPQDWLLPMEILEISEKEKRFPEMSKEIKESLEKLAVENEEYTKLINDGLNLIYNG